MLKLNFFFQAEDGIRDDLVTGVQTCALPISRFGTHRTQGKTTFMICINQFVTDRWTFRQHTKPEIGRASCRERV